MSETKGPHIPKLKWEAITFSQEHTEGAAHHSFWWDAISTTVVTTWVIMIIFLIVRIFRQALKKPQSRIKTTGYLLVRKLDSFFSGIIGNTIFTRKILFLLGSLFVYIIFANIFGLLVDWLSAFLPVLHGVLRPTNSDINTTLGLALTVIVVTHIVMIQHRGFVSYVKGYLFHWEGNNFIEKCISVFVGWLHGIGEFVRILSLSCRLFGNIFAGLVLITLMVYLTGKISLFHINLGEILTLPFWFFEIFVAFVQTLVFCILTGIYFSEAIQEHH